MKRIELTIILRNYTEVVDVKPFQEFTFRNSAKSSRSKLLFYGPGNRFWKVLVTLRAGSHNIRKTLNKLIIAGVLAQNQTNLFRFRTFSLLELCM